MEEHMHYQMSWRKMMGAARVPTMIDLAACAIHRILPSSSMLKLILTVHLYIKS
jgi:hypothetical protein